MAGRALRRGPFQRVRAVGWCRPGDGCNYAVFANDDDPSPDLVVRLPLRRDVESEVEGWFADETNPVLYGGVALFGADGLLGVRSQSGFEPLNDGCVGRNRSGIAGVSLQGRPFLMFRPWVLDRVLSSSTASSGERTQSSHGA